MRKAEILEALEGREIKTARGHWCIVKDGYFQSPVLGRLDLKLYGRSHLLWWLEKASRQPQSSGSGQAGEAGKE